MRKKGILAGVLLATILVTVFGMATAGANKGPICTIIGANTCTFVPAGTPVCDPFQQSCLYCCNYCGGYDVLNDKAGCGCCCT